MARRRRTGLLVHTIIFWFGAAEPERFEVGAARPKLSTSVSAAIAVAVPVARAAGVLPVAYLNLAIRTAAKAGNIQRADLAVCVYICAVRIRANQDLVGDVARAVPVLLDMSRRAVSVAPGGLTEVDEVDVV